MAEGAGLKFGLRLIEMIFGIIAFSTVAEGADDSSRYAYMVFVGVSATVLCLVYMATCFTEAQIPPKATLAIDTIWAIFWLVAAALVSDSLNDAGDFASSKLKASVAFAWLAWFCWCINMVMAFIAVRNG